MDFNTLINELLDKLYGWAESFVLLLPNLVVAIAVVLAFWGISRLASKAAKSIIQRLSKNRAINRLVTNLTSFIILSIGLFIGLSILNLDKAVTSLLAGAGVIGLALGFAFQDISANFISGLLVGIRKPYKHGDHIQSNGYEGIVTDITLRNTAIKTFQGQEVLIPNKEMYQEPLVNFSSRGERRVDLEVGVSYKDDLDKVEKITKEAITGIEGVNKNRDISVFFKEFGGSSINLTANFWLDTCAQPGFLGTRSNVIKALKKAYDNEGISIPFPIRTLDFGIEGGKSLRAMLTDTGPTSSNSK
ncbi:MAG: mechanosensitive ion channel family protein [Bacteroidia bacterium]